jgi:hypothetical protein
MQDLSWHYLKQLVQEAGPACGRAGWVARRRVAAGLDVAFDPPHIEAAVTHLRESFPAWSLKMTGRMARDVVGILEAFMRAPGEGYLQLQLACVMGDAETAAALMDDGVEPVQPWMNNYALEAAARFGRPQVVRTLLDRGVDPGMYQVESCGEAPLSAVLQSIQNLVREQGGPDLGRYWEVVQALVSAGKPLSLAGWGAVLVKAPLAVLKVVEQTHPEGFAAEAHAMLAELIRLPRWWTLYTRGGDVAWRDTYNFVRPRLSPEHPFTTVE